jgi:DNA-binding transcriptional MerR regulator
MRSGELAKLLNVSDQTLINWMSRPEIRSFLSDSAIGESGNTQRIYTEGDVLVLNTVRILRAKGIQNWDEIQKKLDDGEREQEFPQNAIVTDNRTIPLPQAKQAAEYAVAIEQLNAALKRTSDLELLLVEAKRENAELRTEYNTLLRLVGKLEGKLENIKESEQEKRESRNDK